MLANMVQYFPDLASAMRGASKALFARTAGITIPIGQVPCHVAISHVEKQLAITVSFFVHGAATWR